MTSRLRNLLLLQDIGVSDISDSQAADTEELTASSTQSTVVLGVVMDVGLGQHSVVLDLRLAESGGVVGNNDQLSVTLADRLQSGLVAQSGLTGLHHQLEARTDGLGSLLVNLSHVIVGDLLSLNRST